MVGNHTGEGEVGVSRGKGTEHIEVDGRPKKGSGDRKPGRPAAGCERAWVGLASC